MNFSLWSDLHLEMLGDTGKKLLESIKPVSDNLVLAGDITSLGQEKYLDLVFSILSPKFKNIIYTSGNHEHWGNGIVTGWNRIRNVQEKYNNVHCLNNESVVIEGVRFFGGTGWYPKSLQPWTRRLMPDFKLVKDCEPEAYMSHASFVKELVKSDAQVVVSHHLPNELCVVPQYKGNPLNDYFVMGLPDDITDAKLFVFGHTHFSLDFWEKDVHYVTNPRGYPRDKDATWNASLVLEV